MRNKSKILLMLVLLSACITLSGCGSLNTSVVPAQTWQPAAVTEADLQELQSDLKTLQSELSMILKQQSNTEKIETH